MNHSLETVVNSPITTKQNVRLYRDGIWPRLAWGFRVLELPITWIECELESKANKFLKKWKSIPKGGNTKLLYLPEADSGLALPALSTFYKRQQVSRHVLFTSSKDDCVRFLECKERSKATRGSFSPSDVVYSTMSQHPACTKRQLKAHVKKAISDMDDSSRKDHLLSLPVQGRLFQKEDNYTYWSEAVSSLPDREMKFAYNAAIDTLPTNANLTFGTRGRFQLTASSVSSHPSL